MGVIVHIYNGSDSVVVYPLFVVAPIVSVLGEVLDRCFVVLSSLAIILLVKGELITLFCVVVAGLQIRVRIGKLFSLFLIQNIFCGYSKEPSH